jgi:cystathionine gamma-synthase
MTSERDIHPATQAAQALGWLEPAAQGVVPPIYPATTFARAPDYSLPAGRGYTRDQTPAYDQAEALLAALEGGAGAMLFASGMAAATSVFLALRPGDHVVAPRVMYWAYQAGVGGDPRQSHLERHGHRGGRRDRARGRSAACR